MKLLGKVIITSDIEVKTGLRVGGSSGGLKIGGVDLNVITDPEGKPYIPGSSLKGKMRSLLEKKEAVAFSTKGTHSCDDASAYNKCPICRIWGNLGVRDAGVPTLTRLIVRDTMLDPASIEKFSKNLDLKYTEVKFETAINRITGTALHGSLRQIERVPAGAVFKNCEMIFNIFEEGDKDLLKKIFEGMELLEHDYLGGMGSRGYGQVGFRNIAVFWNSVADYENGTLNENKVNGSAVTAVDMVKGFSAIKTAIK